LLFSLCYPRLINFCLLYVRRKEPAEEVVSDVFVKCWLNRENLQEIQNPEVYLFVAVKNQSLNYLKRFSHYHLVSMGEVDTDDLLNSLYPEKELERRELHFHMNQAIASLPRQCQVIFRLIKEDGMKYKEVAEILQISPRTVQTQLSRAIAKLRHTLRPYLERSSGSFDPIDGIPPLIIFILIFFTGL
jgi:RNA polymerase sigma-70 factor (ECF subfamily)